MITTLETVIRLFGFWVIGATTLASFRHPVWWVRLFDFPRVQLVAIAAVTLIAYVAVVPTMEAFDLILISALGACLFYQIYHIYPYTPLAPKQVLTSVRPNPGCQLRLMVANVLMHNRQSTRLKKIISNADPDLILLVETDDWWLTELEFLHQHYPYRMAHPLENTYGMAMYSRFKLIQPEVKFLIQDDVPSIHTRFELPSGVEVELHGVHPRPPSPTEHFRSTERDAELLIVGRAVNGSPRPVIIAGDLNDVAWSRTTKLFQRISGLLDPRIGRGIFGTFHARYPLLRWPLDHVFHSDQLRLLSLKTLPYFGSDHLPVMVDLSYEPKVAQEQESPEPADYEDRCEAQATVREAKRANS